MNRNVLLSFPRHNRHYVAAIPKPGVRLHVKEVAGSCTKEMYFTNKSSVVNYADAEILLGLGKKKHKVCVVVVPKKSLKKEEVRELILEHLKLISSRYKVVYRWLYESRLVGIAGTARIYKQKYMEIENEATLGCDRGFKASIEERE